MTTDIIVPFSTRSGLSWEIEPYRNLIEALCSLQWDSRDLTDLSLTEISTLTSTIYKKWGNGRKGYYISLANFLKKFHIEVKEDCICMYNFSSKYSICK